MHCIDSFSTAPRCSLVVAPCYNTSGCSLAVARCIVSCSTSGGDSDVWSGCGGSGDGGGGSGGSGDGGSDVGGDDDSCGGSRGVKDDGLIAFHQNLI